MTERERQADEVARAEKPDSTGPNARPRNETISQTGSGLPDDSSAPVEIEPCEEKAIESGIRKM